MKIKCKVFTGKEVVRFAHAKLDGHFVKVFTDACGLVHVHTATPTRITHQIPEHLIANVKRYCPPDSAFCGELFVPGQKASQVKRMLASEPSRLKLSLFAVVKWGGKSLPIDASLDDANDLVSLMGMPFVYYERWNGDVDNTLSRFLSLGYEGAVLKYANLDGWYKLKPIKTIDLIVTKLCAGQGRFEGKVGSLECSSFEGHCIANCSGMSDDERNDITDNDIGRVCEVRYQYVGAGGKLRHPAFVRWRDDKAPSDCLITQDQELEDYYASR